MHTQQEAPQAELVCAWLCVAIQNHLRQLWHVVALHVPQPHEPCSRTYAAPCAGTAKYKQRQGNMFAVMLAGASNSHSRMPAKTLDDCVSNPSCTPAPCAVPGHKQTEQGPHPEALARKPQRCFSESREPRHEALQEQLRIVSGRLVGCKHARVSGRPTGSTALSSVLCCATFNPDVSISALRKCSQCYLHERGSATHPKPTALVKGAAEMYCISKSSTHTRPTAGLPHRRSGPTSGCCRRSR